MFKVVKRLKLLKKPLRKLLYDHGNFHENVKRLRHELDEAQKALDFDPNNVELQEEEAAYLQAFTDALLMEEHFLSQKAKVEWLQLGDVNTAYFHKVGLPSYFDSNDLFCNQLTSDASNYMIHVIFSMGDNRAPGPDGYSAAFFKEAIISNRMKDSLSSLVSLNQSAFVLGRRISDNILLTQELMHNYHMDISTPCINGNLHGYFKGKRGLRQGDLMSLYLFTLVMEGDSDFSVAKAWDCIRPKANGVHWFHIVWFSHQIPRHAIHLYLSVYASIKRILVRQHAYVFAAMAGQVKVTRTLAGQHHELGVCSHGGGALHYKNHRIQLLPIERSAHVEDIAESETAIAQIFLNLGRGKGTAVEKYEKKSFITNGSHESSFIGSLYKLRNLGRGKGNAVEKYEKKSFITNGSHEVSIATDRRVDRKCAISVEMAHPHREDGFNRHAKKEKVRREDREHARSRTWILIGGV
nr:hypothetical protein [Tanacetum cinerariifolium]